MSPGFLRRVKRYQADLHDPDVATAQTVELMAQQIRKAAGDPLVQRNAVEAVKQWRGGPLYGMSGRDPFADPLAMAESCWWFAKHHIKFVHHNELIAVWFNEQDQLQLLISPEILVRMRKMEGDCAIYTMLICALLEALGLTWEIVTAAVDGRQPDVFSHVWPRVVLPDGRRVALDASHGDYAGWQVPQERIYKVAIWNEAGRPVGDSPSFRGLHGYRRRGMGQAEDIQEGGTYVPPSGDNSTEVFLPSTTVGSGAGNSGVNWSQLVGNLASQWTQIGSRVLAPSTTYQRNADGSVSLVTPGSSPVLSSSVLTGGAGISGSTLLWIGGGLAALLVVGTMMSKR